METLILDAEADLESATTTASEILKNGGVVVFPTETVYGIGADINNEKAVMKIFEIKKRSLSNPLAAHVSSLEMASTVVKSLTPDFMTLADSFLPGPVSIILEKKNEVNNIVTAGKNSISLRFPDCEVAKDVISKLGRPIAGTSANQSGAKSTTTFEDAFKEFNGKVDAIIKWKKCKYSSESTVVLLSKDGPVILREGVVPEFKIHSILN